MSGGNSYVFEISGGNSHTIQQVPSRKRMQIRHSFSDERKPPVIQIGKTEERMEIRQSFGANGKMNARGSAIRSQTKKPPVVEKHAGFRPPTHGGQLPIGLEKHTAQHWPSQSARTPASRSPSGRVPDASPQRGIAANGGPQPKSARCQRYSDAFSSRGSTRFKMTATTVATAMEEVPNTVLTHAGNRRRRARQQTARCRHQKQPPGP